MNSKKETNGRVSYQGPRWVKNQDGLQWLKSAVKTIESNWAKRSQLGPGSSWAWPILTQGQIGPRSQYGSEHLYHILNHVTQTQAFNQQLDRETWAGYEIW